MKRRSMLRAACWGGLCLLLLQSAPVRADTRTVSGNGPFGAVAIDPFADTVLRFTAPGTIVVSGVAAGYADQRVTVLTTSGTVYLIAESSDASAPDDRLTNPVVGTAIVTPAGIGVYRYDGQTHRWRADTVAQGTGYVPGFTAAQFAGTNAMTWTVAAGNVFTHRYTLTGTQLHIVLELQGTTLDGPRAPALQIALPFGYVIAATSRQACQVRDGSMDLYGLVYAAAGTSHLSVYRDLTYSPWLGATADVLCAVDVELR